uniref:Uncharacterized protein n=1 Tax=Anguilla anguilla TaxID=7936 RepID=A0A0E9R2K5_ANGAN
MNGASQPLFCRFCCRSQRDVRVRGLPNSSCAHHAQLGWISRHSSQEVALAAK